MKSRAMRRLGGPLGFLLCVPLLLGNDSCASAPTAADREAQQTRTMTSQAAVVVGMPAIKNFAEKRLMKMLYELRDDAGLVTYSYTRDLAGKRHPICLTTSVGYGIPYATQYTAGMSMQQYYLPGHDGWSATWGTTGLPQPEPNGLHMPAAAEGTWVVCLGRDGKSLKPAYIESRAEVYLEEMPHVAD